MALISYLQIQISPKGPTWVLLGDYFNLKCWLSWDPTSAMFDFDGSNFTERFSPLGPSWVRLYNGREDTWLIWNPGWDLRRSPQPLSSFESRPHSFPLPTTTSCPTPTSGPTPTSCPTVQVDTALGLLRPFFEKSGQEQVFEPYRLKDVTLQVFARLNDLAEEADTGDVPQIDRVHREWKNFKWVIL